MRVQLAQADEVLLVRRLSLSDDLDNLPTGRYLIPSAQIAEAVLGEGGGGWVDLSVLSETSKYAVWSRNTVVGETWSRRKTGSGWQDDWQPMS